MSVVMSLMAAAGAVVTSLMTAAGADDSIQHASGAHSGELTLLAKLSAGLVSYTGMWNSWPRAE